MSYPRSDCTAAKPGLLKPGVGGRGGGCSSCLHLTTPLERSAKKSAGKSKVSWSQLASSGNRGTAGALSKVSYRTAVFYIADAALLAECSLDYEPWFSQYSVSGGCQSVSVMLTCRLDNSLQHGKLPVLTAQCTCLLLTNEQFP